jgi:hypothetical protein
MTYQWFILLLSSLFFFASSCPLNSTGCCCCPTNASHLTLPCHRRPPRSRLIYIARSLNVAHMTHSTNHMPKRQSPRRSKSSRVLSIRWCQEIAWRKIWFRHPSKKISAQKRTARFEWIEARASWQVSWHSHEIVKRFEAFHFPSTPLSFYSRSKAFFAFFFIPRFSHQRYQRITHTHNNMLMESDSRDGILLKFSSDRSSH